jgi:hypothetical protein
LEKVGKLLARQGTSWVVPGLKARRDSKTLLAIITELFSSMHPGSSSRASADFPKTNIPPFVGAAAEKVMALATNAQSVDISLFIAYPPLELG